MSRLLPPSQHHYSLRVEAARDKSKYPRRFGVQPLHVVDRTHERRAGGHVGQQRQNAQPDQEPVRGRSVDESQRPPQRVSLGAGSKSRLSANGSRNWCRPA